MAAWSHDFRYALRTLGGSPGFTAAALLSLSLAIGANTAIFTLSSAVFLHPLPVSDPAQVVEVFTVDHATKVAVPNIARTGISVPNYRDIRQQNEVFAGVAGFSFAGGTLTGFGKPTQETAFAVTGNYFDVLGLRPAAGRLFGAAESETAAASPTAVLSHGFAQRLFGGDEAALGKTINLNSTAYTVVGVAPANFRGTLTVGPRDVVWLPLNMHARIFGGPIAQLYEERRLRFLNVFGRLKPGVTEAQALANLQTIASRLETAYPRANSGRTFETSSLAEAALGFPRGQTMGATFALTLAVAFVLLIACANLANLSLARATRRAREMGIRMALGAGRSRLIRQLLCEAAVLSFIGGIAGITLGWTGAKYLWTLRPAFLLQSYLDLSLDWRICVFSLGISVLSCGLFGIVPGLRASRPDLSRLLNSSGRGNVQGGGRSRFRAALVIGEIALAMIALAGAGLFVRSMQQAQRLDLGFDADRLGIVGFNLGSQQMTPDQGRQYLHAVVERARTVPGVESASVAGAAPLNGGFLQTVFREGEGFDAKAGVLALTQPISPEYFDTMRIPILEGRAVNSFDRAGTTRVVVISQAMAKQVWPGQKALGRRFHYGTNNDLYEVVGIAKDTTVFNLGETPQPVDYTSYEQAYQPFATLHIRTSGDPERIMPAVTAAIQPLAPDLALVNPGGMRAVIGQALWAPRMAAALFGLFGLLGMALAVIGVYGVMAYTVLQRTSEIGIRMAVGADSASVLKMVAGQSLRLALAGIGAGICGALALTRLVANLLFGVSPNDPATFAMVAIILGMTALLAGGVPAWRASRIDPVRALRQE